MEYYKKCREFRIEHGYTQKQIADDLNYTPMNISAFERGRTNNAKILLWYIEHGLNVLEV